MKKFIVISLFFLFSYSVTYSQVNVNGVNINELDIKYCSIVGYNTFLFGKKIIVSIDYGQKYQFWKSQEISDSNNKPVIFNSVIDALNFMEKNGWQYINTAEYTYTYGNSNASQFLFKKKE